ncbi:MAG: LysR family transcriptional regulator [Myxococcota bacterium]
MNEKKLETLGAEFFRLMPVLVAVGKTGGVSSAGSLLGITAPTVSKALKRLEEVLDTELFERQGKRVVLTAAGKNVFAYCNRWHQEGLELLHDALHTNSVLRVASIGLLDRWFLLDSLRVFRERRPNSRIQIRYPLAGDVAECFSKFRMDVVLGLNLIEPSYSDVLVLAKPSSGFYVGRGHPLYGSQDCGLDEILTYEFIAQRGYVLSRPLWPREHPRNVTLEVDHQHTGIQALLTGQYVAVVVDPSVEDLVESGSLFRLPAEPPVQHDVELCTNRNVKPTEDVQLFLAVLRERFPDAALRTH